ncbi:MAG: hypothetical protein SFY92_09730 [Verrucomicrobiae bacterium]|nr:hypothetical protein [Verrucomicrobiae bacterium]
MNPILDFLGQIPENQGAWTFDTRGKVLERNAGTILTEEKIVEVSTMVASLFYVYAKNYEPIMEISFLYDNHRLWVRTMGNDYVALMMPGITPASHIQGWFNQGMEALAQLESQQ